MHQPLGRVEIRRLRVWLPTKINTFGKTSRHLKAHIESLGARIETSTQRPSKPLRDLPGWVIIMA